MVRALGRVGRAGSKVCEALEEVLRFNRGRRCTRPQRITMETLGFWVDDRPVLWRRGNRDIIDLCSRIRSVSPPLPVRCPVACGFRPASGRLNARPSIVGLDLSFDSLKVVVDGIHLAQ
jgi:hypothetical protein